MAIEQNKNYTLKGSQIEDLAGRVNDAQENASDALEGLSNKVDKETGKGLSTNDFTNLDKSKLDSVEANAQENTIESVSVNGTEITPDANKNVDINVPAVENSLTSESTTDALSAAQGKTLKELIDNIPTSSETHYLTITSRNTRHSETQEIWNISENYTHQQITDWLQNGETVIVIFPWNVTTNRPSWLASGNVSVPLHINKKYDGSYSTYLGIYNNPGKDYYVSFSGGIASGISDKTIVISAVVKESATMSSVISSVNDLTSEISDIEPISGSGAPTTSTEGTLGQDYIDTTTGDKYYLSEIDDTTTPVTYTWTKYTTGTGVNVVQTTGTSTTDVMSQNAVTSMVFNNPGTNTQIRIGSNASATGTRAVAIGGHEGIFAAVASGQGALALGVDSIAGAKGTISFPYSRTSVQGVVQFGISISGSAVGNEGYNSSTYRLLSGVYDPQAAHDAATKGYVDTNIPNAPDSTDFNALFD